MKERRERREGGRDQEKEGEKEEVEGKKGERRRRGPGQKVSRGAAFR